jgi:hypothetical protein
MPRYRRRRGYRQRRAWHRHVARFAAGLTLVKIREWQKSMGKYRLKTTWDDGICQVDAIWECQCNPETKLTILLGPTNASTGGDNVR